MTRGETKLTPHPLNGGDSGRQYSEEWLWVTLTTSTCPH